MLPMMIVYRQSQVIENKELDIKELTDSLFLLENASTRADLTIKNQKMIIRSLTTFSSKKMALLGKFICTAYEASAISCGQWADGITSELVPVGLGIAAADHRLLPPYSILYLPELDSYFIVLDKGGAIKGRRLDLYTQNVKDARTFGRQQVTVFILRRDNHDQP